MKQAFYRRYRPQTWDQILGQEHIIQTLKNAVQGDRMVHAYLFAGPRGTGKTSTARILAKAVNCLDDDPAQRPCNHCEHCNDINQARYLDLIEIDAASNTSVDDVRDLREKINFSPSQGQFKVYIIDEVHMLSTAAFNALLKTLEEPPSHAIFILATTEIHKIPATVLSRCQRYEFRRIPVATIIQQLEEIVEEEELIVEPEALALIARQSTGAMRDAISLLDQLASTGESITLAKAQTVLGTATSQSVVDLIEALLSGSTAEGLNAIHKALDSGTDPRQFARQVVDYLRNILLIRLGNGDQVDTTQEMQTQMAKHAERFEYEALLKTLQLFNSAASETHSNWQPNLPLELALAEAVETQQNEPTPQLPPVTGRAKSNKAKTTPAREAHSEQPGEDAAAQAESPPRTLAQIAESPSARLDADAASRPTSPAPEPEAGAPAPPQEVSLSEIKQHWEEICNRVRAERPQTRALLNSLKTISVKNGVLVLGFASDVVKSKMELDDNSSLTSSVIQEVLGKEVAIHCVVVSKKIGSGSSDLQADGDGMVNAAIGLGGQIVQKE
jgi:DNA polymerase-3 subunit gamma/tau